MKKSLLVFASVVLAVIFTSRLHSQIIKIDGLFFEWQAKWQLDKAPNASSLTFAEGGETDPPRGSFAADYFINMDLSHIYGVADNNFVYLRINMNPGANVVNIPTDKSYHGGGSIAVYISVDPGSHDTTGLTWDWWGSGYDYMVQVFPFDSVMFARSGFQQPIWEHDQKGTGWTFEVKDTLIGASVAWNSLNNMCEVAVPKSLLFKPRHLPGFKTPDSVAILVYAGENESPWRADYACNAGVRGYLLSMNATTGVKEGNLNQVVNEFDLVQNYPNPFNPTTEITYSLRTQGDVSLTVSNILGQKVSSLVNGIRSAGVHTVAFNANGLPSGMYFYTLQSGDLKKTNKMLLLK